MMLVSFIAFTSRRKSSMAGHICDWQNKRKHKFSLLSHLGDKQLQGNTLVSLQCGHTRDNFFPHSFTLFHSKHEHMELSSEVRFQWVDEGHFFLYGFRLEQTGFIASYRFWVLTAFGTILWVVKVCIGKEVSSKNEYDVVCSIDQLNVNRMFNRSDISLARPHAGGSEHHKAILLLAHTHANNQAK